jgi:phosphatidylglycerophosphate synthase
VPTTAADQSTERRPIAARNLTTAKRLSRWLAARGVSPNAISLASMVFGIASGAAFALTTWLPDWSHFCWLAGALCVQLRLLMNMLDGMVAIETGAASRLGELYNEVPDRISDAATLIGLGYAAGSSPALGFIAACIAIFVAYIRAMGKAAGAPQAYCGPMAKPHRMFTVTLVALYCGLAPAFAQPTWTIKHIDQPVGLPVVGLLVIIVGCVITAARRLSRIGRALRGSP